MDIKKYFLNEVVCFATVPQNSTPDAPDGTCEPPEQPEQGLPVASAYSGNQTLIAFNRTIMSRYDLFRDSLGRSGQRKRREPCCGSVTQTVSWKLGGK